MRVTVSTLDINKKRVTKVYEGELVAVPRWIDYDAIALTTGQKDFKVRIIDVESIVKIDGEHIDLPVKKSQDEVVQVNGSKGDKYVVTISKDRYDCSCSGFQFRRTCKHVVQVKKQKGVI